MKKSDWSKWGREARAMQTEPPRPKVLRPCPKCGKEFGARELRKHIPRCGAKIKKALIVVFFMFCSLRVIAQKPPAEFNARAFMVMHSSGYMAGLADTSLSAAAGHGEANPLSPDNTPGRVAVVSASWALVSWVDYRFAKRHRIFATYAVPVMGILAHGYGIYTGVRAIKSGR